MPITWDDSGSGQGAVGAGVGVGAAAGAVSALDAKAIAKTSAATRQLLDAANSGGFRISPEGVQPLRDALAKMQIELMRLQQGPVYFLSQKPQLGSHDYGEAVASHDQKSASQEAVSAAKVLEEFSRVLHDADNALGVAIQNYQEAEDDASGAFNGRV